MWKSRGTVPAEHCPAIEALTRRIAEERQDLSLVVTCEDLRDDVQWGVLRSAPPAEPVCTPIPRAEHAQASDHDKSVLAAARALMRTDDDLAPAPAVTEDRRHPESAREWIAPKRRISDKPRA
jgi:DNA-binding transcriptional regulator YdaS (Cro superfamily)